MFIEIDANCSNLIEFHKYFAMTPRKNQLKSNAIRLA
jgi:hypothetical protein